VTRVVGVRLVIAGVLVISAASCTINVYHHWVDEPPANVSPPAVGASVVQPSAGTEKLKPPLESAAGNTSTGGNPASEQSASSTQPANTSGVKSARIILATNRGSNSPLFSPGENIVLTTSVNVDSYVSCFYREADGNIRKIYPNRYSPDSFRKANEPLAIPGVPDFEIRTEASGKTEAFLCIAASADPEPFLPSRFRLLDFSALPVSDFDELFKLYRSKISGGIIGRSVTIKVE